MSSVQFRDETANLLGPQQFDDEARQRYLEFTDELFGDNQSQTFDPERMDTITAKWRGWMSGLRDIVATISKNKFSMPFRTNVVRHFIAVTQPCGGTSYFN